MVGELIMQQHSSVLECQDDVNDDNGYYDDDETDWYQLSEFPKTAPQIVSSP